MDSKEAPVLQQEVNTLLIAVYVVSFIKWWSVTSDLAIITRNSFKTGQNLQVPIISVSISPHKCKKWSGDDKVKLSLCLIN
jgi:hypothetical protein